MKQIATMIAGLWLLVVIGGAVFAPYVTTYDAENGNILESKEAPSAAHWLGTDQQGRDVLTRILYGARTTLLTALFSTLVAMGLSVATGVVAGYFGGWIDRLITRLWDVIISLPTLILALVLVTVFGREITTIAVVISLVFTPVIGRLIRSQVLVIRRQSYIEAARLAGVSHVNVMGKHVLINLLPIILVRGTLALGFIILDLSALSYLGVGVQPPAADWGAILAQGRHTMLAAPWPALSSGFAIALTVLAFHLVSDGLQTRLHPKASR